MNSWPLLRHFFRGYATWILFDAPIILGGFAFALVVRSLTAPIDFATGLTFASAVVVAFVGANWLFGVYNRYWSYAAAQDAVAIMSATGLGFLFTLGVDLLFVKRPLPISVVIAGAIFAMCGQITIRYRRRLLRSMSWTLRQSLRRVFEDGTPTLILGAGESAQAFAFRMQMSSAGQPYRILGYLDDDPAKVGKLIHGVPVLAPCDRVVDMVDQYGIELVVIAIHNISLARRRQLIDLCMQTQARISLLPDALSMLAETTELPYLRSATIEDLIERSSVPFDLARVRALLSNQVVLITGACGSIGSELAHQILRMRPRQLILVDNNESGIHDLMLSLEAACDGIEEQACLVPVVGDITLNSQVNHIFRQYKPRVVMHAAAYKHVKWMEENPLQAIRVNVLGTHNIMSTSRRYGVDRFVAISTDKAVEPTSIMGATKRFAELLILSDDPAEVDALGDQTNGMAGFTASGQRELLACAVRFGNVVGSRGSVVPTFERQIAAGGPVTITDPRMRRYFLSVGEAVSLVLSAASLSQGGDLFVLDMGHDISIRDLANRMIRLRGLRPEIDIPIQYTGMRSGEKLAEQLHAAYETLIATGHPGVLQVKLEHRVQPVDLSASLAHLEQCVADHNETAAVSLLWSVVSHNERAPVPTSAVRE